MERSNDTGTKSSLFCYEEFAIGNLCQHDRLGRGIVFGVAITQRCSSSLIPQLRESLSYFLAGEGGLDRLGGRDDHLNEVIADGFEAVRVRRLGIGLGISGSERLLTIQRLATRNLRSEHEAFCAG